MQFLQLIKANTRMEFIEMKRYLPNTISMFLTFYFIFLGLFFGIDVIGDPQQADTNIQYAIVNMVFWYLTMMTLANIGFTITQEAMRGTLEQLYMSPYGVWRILLARFTGYLLMNSIIIVLLLAATMATSGQWLNLSPHLTIPILLLTIIGIIGVGFMIAGACVIFKQVQSFMQILQFILLGLAFVPLAAAPYLVLAPFVKGFDMVRQITIQGYTYADFTAFDFYTLVANSIFYVIIGVIFYLQCEKIAMQKGLLSNY
ncbi:ABC transporter permease [Halalkalibacillus halophilus]|uniref:ABC transporter permease n=1 Tax=Halalkalibacillus halophilus TaxID=392827 RepID=UPI0003FAC556|nr:ABC transporter permease [Halalkalibacillus halophilus]